MLPTIDDALAADKLACSRSLAYFVERAWRHIIPDTYQHGWHIDAICEHLEAVNAGRLRGCWLMSRPARPSRP